MKIAYDPIYNFHSGYHQEIVESTANQIDWIKSSLVNYYEDCVWNSRNIDLRSSLFNHGYFVFDTDCDLIFSPHMLLENKTPYILELEKVNWLFADDYRHTSLPVEPWKIKLFEGLVMKDNLRAVVWYSKAAQNDFVNSFAPKYLIAPNVTKKIMTISHTIYPSSIQSSRSDDFRSTKNNKFVIVASEKNWYRKGVDIIISVFLRLHEEGVENWSLKIVGGSLPEEISNKITKISERVDVVGLINKNCLLDLLRQSDCLLVASRAETFGTVIVQAINSGCFVIASSGQNTFATKEILEPWTHASSLIESYVGDDEFDKPNELEFYKRIKDFIHQNRQHPAESPDLYSRKHLSKTFIDVINKL